MKDARKQTTVWLPADLYRWLRHEAIERDITQSEFIRRLLEAERVRHV